LLYLTDSRGVELLIALHRQIGVDGGWLWTAAYMKLSSMRWEMYLTCTSCMLICFSLLTVSLHPHL
jgi:hypothetical protein